MATAAPIEKIPTNAMPRPGFVNQLVKPINSMMPAVPTVAMPKIIQTLERDPPMMADQNTPLISESATTHGKVTCGSARKLLKPIARYCFKRTANQKTGSEKHRNA